MPVFAARVVARRNEAEGVIALDMEPVEADILVEWEPGAHIDVMVDDETWRQYSLYSAEGRSWSIAIQLAPDGRGGSKRLFESAFPGSVFSVSHPRNRFELVPAERYVFIAGGIGITPIKPMLERASANGAEWTLWYGGRSRDRMAFADRLVDDHGNRVKIIAENESGRIPIDDVLDEHRGSIVYCCGPETLIHAVALSAESRGMEFRCERFSGVKNNDVLDRPFDIKVHSTGQVLTVHRGQSIADVLIASGIDVFTSCREGVCGSCETGILEGHAEHRDSVLSAEERDSNSSMMVCVSRSTSDLLVLDV